MEVYVLIVEFVFGTHCIITQWQVKPKLPDSSQLLHRDTTFSIGITVYAKSTIARLPFGRHVPTLRSDSIFLAIGSMVRPNYLMLSFLEGNFYCTGRSKILTCMTIVWVHARPFTISVPYSNLHITWGGTMMESFAGLLQRLAVWWVSQCLVEVDARFDGVLIRNTNIDTIQQSTTTNAWEGYQMTAPGIFDRPLCSWKVLCTGMESNGGMLMW